MGEAASVSGGDPNQTGGGFVHLRVRSAYSLLEGAIGDAQQGVVRQVHARALEVDVVGRHQRDVGLIGEGHQVRLGRGLGR